MWPYFAIYIILALLALYKNKIDNLSLLIIGTFLTIFIGLRFDIGSDWSNYQRHVLTDFADLDFDQIFANLHPSYLFTLWISKKLNLGIFGLTTINAAIFVFGLLTFCRTLRYPLMGLLVSFPYLIVGVAMNNVSQASAIGLELIALSYFLKGKIRLFYLYIISSFTFHFTAIYLFSFPIIHSLRKIKNIKTQIGLSLSFLTFYIFLYDSIFKTYSSYYMYFVETEYLAAGAAIKILILVSYASIYFLLKKNFKVDYWKSKLLTVLSISTFLMFIFFLTFPSTTASYRLSLYLLPIQLITADAITESKILKISKSYWKLLFTITYFTLLFVWLNFSNNSVNWIPYKNLLFI